MNPTIQAFIQAINQQDLEAINELMADDFSFIDTYGNSELKERMITGWPGYFEWFPDYLIDIQEYVENDEFTVILGFASGSYLGKPERAWRLPAAWKVVVEGGQIKVWQVYCDSKKQLDAMA